MASFLAMSVGTALGRGVLGVGRNLSHQYAASQNRNVDLDASLQQQETSEMLSMYR
jgi:hypothetical protein|eukprot:COSAG06_NODE_3356_length_5459_cov_9.584452_3_plen_56_part_00